MSDAWAIVIAALITALGGIGAAMMTSMRKLRKENRDDHGQVMQKLDAVNEGLTYVSDRLDNHIDWHIRK